MTNTKPKEGKATKPQAKTLIGPDGNDRLNRRKTHEIVK